MILSYEGRWFFLAQPKTGSTSIEARLAAYGARLPEPRDVSPRQIERWQRRQDHKHRKHLSWRAVRDLYGSEVANTFTSIAVKRDPVDRFLSHFFFRKREELADPNHRFHRRFVGDTDLDRYLDGIAAGTIECPRGQVHRLIDEEGVIRISRLIRFENLQSDFDEICAAIGLPQQALPHRNPSVKRSGFKVDNLGSEQYCRIVALFAEDIVRLGYGDRHPLACDHFGGGEVKAAHR